MTEFTYKPHEAPRTDGELKELVKAFEAGTLPRERWTHAAHLSVGASYIHALGFDDALPVMRVHVRAYNEAAGTPNTATRGYHETLTRLWLLVLDQLRRQNASIPCIAFVQLAVEHYGNLRDLHTNVYSFDVVRHPLARREWVEPDLQAAVGIAR